MRNLRVIALLLLAACAPAGTEQPSAPAPGAARSEAGAGWRLDPQGDVNAFLDCLEAEGIALVSAHRAGPAPGLPENALETAAALLAEVPALVEIDVAASADGVLYLMHDETLDRTTTGEGPVDALAWAAIERLRLKDDDGAPTPRRPTRFDEMLAWAKDRTILKIDFKRSARYEDVIAEIRRQGAEDRVVLIAYTTAQAERLHALAPEMMISLSLDTVSALNRAVAAGVPDERLLAFTGLDAPRPRLNDALDARDVETIFGALGRPDRSIDGAIAASGDEARYAEIAAAGVDIIATDRPRQAHAALAAAGRGARDGVCGIARR
ncbi:glycerophosphodiester phosphodiesterase family protein [Amphiplicatus metriothermophilus]|nr:glycerophosphodiester phosphodiesterase family protein [Amphiplicatus metriothermophilus]MBB5517661.1 glycerophosphoryl diester phosphodiesterase [Amphiplicatus metriothermophilus]